MRTSLCMTSIPGLGKTSLRIYPAGPRETKESSTLHIHTVLYGRSSQSGCFRCKSDSNEKHLEAKVKAIIAFGTDVCSLHSLAARLGQPWHKLVISLGHRTPAWIPFQNTEDSVHTERYIKNRTDEIEPEMRGQNKTLPKEHFFGGIHFKF